jgi:hypothetical protein
MGHLQVGVALQPGAQVTQLPATFKPRIYYSIHRREQKPRLLELGSPPSMRSLVALCIAIKVREYKWNPSRFVGVDLMIPYTHRRRNFKDTNP